MKHSTKRFFYSIIEHKIFQTGLYIKSVYGIIESAAGILLLFISSRYITQIIEKIFGHELIKDPNDVLGNLFMNFASSLSLRLRVFLAVFMIGHGLLNISIALALMHKKLWVFPLASTLLALLIIYQTYTFVHNHSITLLIITFVDVILFGLLGFEYHRLRNNIKG